MVHKEDGEDEHIEVNGEDEEHDVLTLSKMIVNLRSMKTVMNTRTTKQW